MCLELILGHIKIKDLNGETVTGSIYEKEWLSSKL